MSDASIKIWDTCGYVRLSREDGDKEESNSVTGQKDLIRDFLSRHPELRECGMKAVSYTHLTLPTTSRV